MASEGSVTHWLGRLRAGDAAAAQQLWQRYFPRLAGLARRKLQGTPRRVADEEDVALSAFDSFFRGLQAGRFPQLLGRDNLWSLLVAITAQKAINLTRYEGRRKRGGPAGETPRTDPPAEDVDFDQLLGREPTPAFAAQLAEECRRLLDGLHDPALRAVALWKMEGYTTEEIAAKLGCVVRTVERKVQIIRTLWTKDETP